MIFSSLNIEADLFACITTCLARIAAVIFYPNEWESHSWQRFWPTTKAKALIGVGTFIPLIDFTNGPFEVLIMMDHDLLAYNFNRNHLHLINTIIRHYPMNNNKQRYQYIASMFDGWLSEDQLADLISDQQAEEKKIIKLLRRIAENAFATSVSPPDVSQAQEILKEIHLKAHRAEAKDLDEVSLKDWFIHMSAFKPFWIVKHK